MQASPYSQSLRSPRWSLIGGFAVALAALGGGSFSAQASGLSAEGSASEAKDQLGGQALAARLSGAQEVPSNNSKASGRGSISADPATKKITATLTLTGISARAAHIHSGVVGSNGGVIFGLTETTPGSGIWVSPADATLTDEQFTALNAGGLYFNAHSEAFPGGEIRGQIGRLVRYAAMSGAQEVPPNGSTATGTGTLVIDPRTLAASGSIKLVGMTATAAHIHIGAAGVNGGVIVGLSNGGGGVFNVPSGTVLTAEQFVAYKKRELYFNAHSAAFPGGEIRGQIR
jgi:hypothetical protein